MELTFHVLLAPTFGTEGRGHRHISFARCQWVLAVDGCTPEESVHCVGCFLCCAEVSVNAVGSLWSVCVLIARAVVFIQSNTCLLLFVLVLDDNHFGNFRR